MKKIFTLMLSGLFFLAATAAERQPQVIVNSTSEFDVKIDGKFYNGNATTIPNLSTGMHTVEVYRKSTGLFKKRELVSKTQFDLRTNDVRIDVDRYGQARINQSGRTGTNNRDFRRDRENRNNDVYDDNGNGRDNRSNGRGNKYGHYKNKNNKQMKDHPNGKNKKDKKYQDDDYRN